MDLKWYSYHFNQKMKGFLLWCFIIYKWNIVLTNSSLFVCLFLTTELFHCLYHFYSYMLHFHPVSLIFSYTNTSIFTRIHNFSYIIASTHCVVHELPELFCWSRSRRQSFTHTWLRNGSLSFWEDWLWMSPQLWDTYLKLRKEEDSTSAESPQTSVRWQML